VDGEGADIAAREKQWLHYERIGGNGQTLAIYVYDCLVIEARQYRIPQCGQEDIADQLGAQFAAAAMPEQDGILGRERYGTAEFDDGFRCQMLS